MNFFISKNVSSKDILLYTVYFSLIIQLLTGVVQLHGLTFKFNEDNIILKDVLILETVVQFVEAFFYVYIISALTTLRMNSVTPRRYIDWMITTPIMLISTIMYMEYTKQIENKNQEKKSRNGFSFVKNNISNITKIFFYNGMMLLFGYLGETNKLNLYVSNVLGFVFFILSFYVIYSEYAYTSNTTEINKILFNLMFIIWAFYGIAALFPTLYKNIGYNILDLFSKNFYGLFIYYNILMLNK